MSFMSKKVGMISLGCPKNQVDGEIMLSKLADNGFEITNDVDGADVVIVNTCGFIEDAKKEAIVIKRRLKAKQLHSLCVYSIYQHFIHLRLR